MEIPVEIEFRHMEQSEALSQFITQKAEKLLKIASRATHCHIIVQAPHHHHHKGQQYQVVIQLSVPGRILAVNQHGEAPTHEDAYVAVRDAFSAMNKQVKSYADKQKGHVKAHDAGP